MEMEPDDGKRSHATNGIKQRPMVLIGHATTRRPSILFPVCAAKPAARPVQCWHAVQLIVKMPGVR